MLALSFYFPRRRANEYCAFRNEKLPQRQIQNCCQNKAVNFLSCLCCCHLHQACPPCFLLSSLLSFCNLSGERGHSFPYENWKVLHVKCHFRHRLEKEAHAGFLRQKLSLSFVLQVAPHTPSLQSALICRFSL